MKPLLFVGIALALAAPAWAQSRTQAPQTQTPTQAQPQARTPAQTQRGVVTQSGSADVEFILKAAQGGMAEVELGRVASQQAASDEVKKFGQRMVDDHGKGGEELKTIAQSRGITLPADIEPRDKALKDRLAKLNGKTFDRTYMRNMVADHKTDVAEFKREANSGKDPEVKAWAAKMLPTLEDHLKDAQTANKAATTGAAN
jgi:putative membrane protein